MVGSGVLVQAQVGVEEEGRRIQTFVDELKTLPIAVQTKAANEQHYEVQPTPSPWTGTLFFTYVFLF